jgi:hypothetical protein
MGFSGAGARQGVPGYDCSKPAFKTADNGAVVLELMTMIKG